MKTSKLEQIVAEMRAERAIVDACIAELGPLGDMAPASTLLTRKSEMLGACITRLSGNGTEAPKPARTRKSRKATEPPTIVSNSNPSANGVLR